MSYVDVVTSDLSRFGFRELKLAAQLLTAYTNNKDFNPEWSPDGTKIAFNTRSGYVFLTNDEYQTAMMNGDHLEMWYNCSYCGHEGFADDFEHEPKAKECVEDMQRIVPNYVVPDDYKDEEDGD